jgi:UPF0755 protein
VLLLVSLYVHSIIFAVPKNFPVDKNFTVNENESIRSISKRLEEEGYISSSLLFRTGVSFLGKDRVISLGGYAFPKGYSLVQMITIFGKGRADFPLLSVTIPEGSTSFEVASILVKAAPTLSASVLHEIIAKYQADGKLFPSTYFLLPSYKEEDVVNLMLSTFMKKVGSLAISSAKIPTPLTSESEVLVLASILEGEANSEESMKIVAGILLSRLSKGMPLQVDVAPITYKQKGLPLVPINNPGLSAIASVLHATPSEYLFYITGNDGKMYYAKTFEEHKKNIKMYLK